ncbi:hypothetical protein NDU88_000828 [Pleurodeles waltl]|uniref:Uncharacterized protein n=1 Tax=Pleurodeles waltl TaxID=8319 RepID=A0AAV7P402_PLEWA|nr:hypothetical protein NDU88_000828 [Pleurodeles waltl]
MALMNQHKPTTRLHKEYILQAMEHNAGSVEVLCTEEYASSQEGLVYILLPIGKAAPVGSRLMAAQSAASSFPYRPASAEVLQPNVNSHGRGM